MARYLLIGDPHVTTRELEDCSKLRDLIFKQAEEKEVLGVIILGDLYHANFIVHTPVINFWNDFFSHFEKRMIPCVALVGNHDQFSPTIRDPHSLIVHSNASVVAGPTHYPHFAALPYYADPEEFIQKASVLKGLVPDTEVLICHQTFNGAKFNEGFYAKDAVDPGKVPFKYIISGHIHSEHTFSNVWYPGSPRWRTLNDANQNKYIYVVDFNKNSWKLESAIDTSSVCRPIVCYKDTQEKPCETFPLNADLRVDVYGTPEYVKDRILELAAKYNAKCRPFPKKEQAPKLTEQDGIPDSFAKYANSFTPPNKTPANLLNDAIKERLNAA